MKKVIILILCTFCLWTINFTLPANALDAGNGAEIFSFHCAGCHVNGGNIIREVHESGDLKEKYKDKN
jgi:cytochrome c6